MADCVRAPTCLPVKSSKLELIHHHLDDIDGAICISSTRLSHSSLQSVQRGRLNVCNGLMRVEVFTVNPMSSTSNVFHVQ